MVASWCARGIGRGAEGKGRRAHVLRGASAAIVDRLAAETEAGAVYWNRRYDEAGRAIDAKLKASLKARGILAESFNASLPHEPWSALNKAGAPFRVFSAYWRAACGQGEPDAPLAAPRKLTFSALPKKLQATCILLADLDLRPNKPDWAAGLARLGNLAKSRRIRGSSTS